MGKQFCFKLHSLCVIAMDVFLYDEARLIIGFKFDSVNHSF